MHLTHVGQDQPDFEIDLDTEVSRTAELLTLEDCSLSRLRTFEDDLSSIVELTLPVVVERGGCLRAELVRALEAAIGCLKGAVK